MEIAKTIEKNNLHIEEYIQKYNSDLIVSTLDDELKVNPYIRFNASGMIKKLKKMNMPVSTEVERFKSIMEVY